MSAERGSGRSIQACIECRRSKLKCDGMFRADSTCSRCRRRGKACHWSVPLPGAAAAVAGDSSDASLSEDYESQKGSQPGASSNQNGFGSAFPSSMAHVASKPSFTTGMAPLPPARSPSSFNGPGGSGIGHMTTLPPLRGNVGFAPHGLSPLSTSGSPRSSGPTPPSTQSFRRTLPWSGSSDHATSPRYQTTSWSRRRSRSPEPRRDRYPPSEQHLAHRESRRGSASTAPLQHLREIALLSPATVSDGARRGSVPDAALEDGAVVSPEQVRLDAARDEMTRLQKSQGWDKRNLDAASAERRSFFERAVAPEPAALRQLDPLENGLLDEEDVDRLFALFYEAINTQHCLLDPERDSPREVRRKSLALFIVICAAASSCDDHPRSRQCMKTLLQNMDKAASHLILSNSKSVEVIKAVILSFLFTQKPSRIADDRCWLLVDTAVRTASELGLGHRLRNSQANISSSDSHAIRSAERAWAIAIIMQRSLGTFTGMWALNKLDVNWEKLDAWCNCDLTIPGDVQLVAYLYLRRIEHHTRSQFELIDQEKFLTLESVRVSFNALFDNWRAQWVDHPKILTVRFSRDFLLTIGLHIQLLLNVTAMRLSQGRGNHNDTTRAAPPGLQDHCVDLAVALCQHFVANFQHRAHQLCRNIVSMVTWSALALLQMDFERGHLLALRVALLLAGDADDELHHTNFPAFYGRWLLSLINDLAADVSVRKSDPSAMTTIKSGTMTAHSLASSKSTAPTTSNGVDARMTVPVLTSAMSLPISSRSGTQEQGKVETSALGGDTVSGGGLGPIGRNADGGIAASVGADKVLSAMAAPLSSDPFNEAWLNQFLDSLAPASWPTAEDAAALSGAGYLC